MSDINSVSGFSASSPVRVGIVGTGFVAKLRAETLQADVRARLITAVGHWPESTEAFCQKYQIEPSISWRKLVEREDLDLVIVCTVNRDHGAIARAALQNGKHVVVEYPLSLDVAEAEELVTLAREKNRLLHVEHIELLGGLHQALKQALPAIGQIFYTRYVTISPQRPVPQKWTYQPSLFGFPLVGALSRLHRFIDLFGQVNWVSCQSQFWETEPDFYKACLCSAQFRFSGGILAETVYGKGETFWQSENTFSVYGEAGTLIVTPEAGTLIQGDNQQNIEVGTRRGLFAKDTTMVLDFLVAGVPLYINPEASLYTLKVADTLRIASETNQTLMMS